MRAYVLRRIMLAIPTLILVTMAVFSLVRLIPGSAIDLIIAQNQNATLTDLDRKEIEHRLGLDKPVWQQYLKWVGGVLHGDLGHSLYDFAYWNQPENS